MSAAAGVLTALILIEGLSRLGPRFFHVAAGRDSPEFQAVGVLLCALGVLVALAVRVAWKVRIFSWTLVAVFAVAYLPMAFEAPLALLPESLAQRVLASFGETALVVLGVTVAPAVWHLVRLAPTFHKTSTTPIQAEHEPSEAS